jgi:PAS domain S-box-containing protein
MSGKSIRVLVVEDNLEDFDILRIMFSKIQHQTFTLDNASTFESGIDRLRRQEHDVYLVDYKLGPDSGVDFLRQAVQVEMCQAPIIFLTGFGDHELDMEAMSLGAADFLNKNKLDPDILERTIRYAIERKKADGIRSRLATIVESTEDAVYSTSLSGIVLSWNPGAQRIYGYTPEEIGGRSLSLIVDPAREGEFPEILKTVRQGKAVSNFDTVHRTKNNTNLIVSLTVSPIKDALGRVSMASIVARDITARRKSEDVQSHLAAILQQTPDAVFGADLDGRIFSWNRGAETMLGYGLEEIVGENTSILLPSERSEEMEKVRKLAILEQNVPSYETVMVKKDGHLVDVSVMVSPIKDTRGRIIGVSAISRDISERKKTEESLKKREEELRLSQKMDAIGRLAGGVAHDFNNLLSVVGGNADFILSALEQDNPHRDELEEIQKAVRRGAELTKQLLLFGRKQVSKPQAVNLNDLSAEMQKMLKRLIDASIELSIIQGKDLRPIQADSGQIQQVILNLVLNARDAMPNGGHLIIETGNVPKEKLELEQRPTIPADDYVRLNVTDTGTGIPLEIQKHIFEPFFTTKADKGTGLGLATVYGIVTKWNGHIFLHSTPGLGTTFAMYFPALPESEKPMAKAKQIALIPQGTETILLAEDEDPVRKVLRRTLERYGYKVLEAQNGLEAIKKAWDYKDTIHLLLTDTIMPKMNGKQLADELLKSRLTMKVLFVSGYPREVLSQQGILGSNIHLVQKPFELEELAKTIRNILDEK